MSISNIPAPCSNEAPRPPKGIIGKNRIRRLRLASESDELLIRDSIAKVLGAEKDLLIGYEAMTGVPFKSDEHASLVLMPQAGSSRKLPKYDVEMAQWDSLYEKIQAAFQALQAKRDEAV